MTVRGGGWRSVAELVTGDVVFLTERAKGCPDCGRIEERRVRMRGGQEMVLFYPGVECCPAAVKRQIEWRQADIERVNRTMADRDKAVRELREAVDFALNKVAMAQMDKKAAVAEKSFMTDVERVYTPQMHELSAEIVRLKKKLTTLENQT